jgi:hypothetical protein
MLPRLSVTGPLNGQSKYCTTYSGTAISKALTRLKQERKRDIDMTEQLIERRAERWHLKKEIQLTHVISTIVVIGAVLAYVSKIEQRLTIVETQLMAQRDATLLQRAQLERMDAKLDRLIERGSK